MIMSKCLCSHFYFESDSTFVETFEKVLAQASIDSKIGLIATGDSFIAGQDKIDAIKGHFPEVLAVEMEEQLLPAAHSVKSLSSLYVP